MAELTFKSPGVSTREIDLSGPSRVGPVGVPAGVIGTATKGRAFVPLVFANLSEFVGEFGAIGSDKFGPMALREWFSNARAGLYLRVLGAGDGKARIDSTLTGSKGEGQPAGSVLNAGFVVGERQVDPSSGRLYHNSFAGSNVAPAKANAVIMLTHGTIDTGDKITLVSTDGTVKTYTAAASLDASAREFRHDTNANLANDLKACIEHANNHENKITATVASSDSGGARQVTLEQVTPGAAGNTVILGEDQANVKVLPAGLVVTSHFTGGVDGQGVPGRTHFLACMMKEVPHAKASAEIKVAAAGAAITSNSDRAKIVGKSITIVDTAGTSKQYVIVDQATDDPAKNTGDLIAAGNVLGTGVTVAAVDSRIGAVAVAIPNVESSLQSVLLTQLQAAINNANGHNAGVANSNINIAIAGETMTLTQVKFGRDGNTVITNTIGHSNVTVASTFANGAGELIFREAGVGLDAVTAATGVKFAPVLRGVMMFASGVVPAMSSSRASVSNNTPIGQKVFTPATSATAKITVSSAPGGDASIFLTDGTTTREYRCHDGATNAAATPAVIDRTGRTATQIAADLATTINHTGDSRDIGITAVAVGGVVTLTQDTAGVGGNTVIRNAWTNTAVSNDAQTFVAGANGVFYGGSAAVNQVSANSSDVMGSRPGLDNGGSSLGTVNITSGKQEFVMLLNGHKATSNYPNAITASFDPQASNYFPNLFNTDPAALQSAGHLLYTHYDVFGTYATPVAADNPYMTSTGRSGADMAMLLRQAADRNSGHASSHPNTDNFCDRFRTAVTPWITSQKFGGVSQDLFKVHALDDGEGGNSVFKITIENIRRSQSEKDRFGSFDLVVRDINDSDREPRVLERFSAVNLNAKSDRYVARIVGDYRLFYDFDKRAGSQKLSLHGKFENNSRNIRVEVSAAVANGSMDDTALPFGFRGIPKLQIDGNDLFTNPDSEILDSAKEAHKNIKMPPVPLRRTIGVGVVPKKRAQSAFCWGIQTEADDLYYEPNKNSRAFSMLPSLSKYFPDFSTGEVKFLLRDNAAANSYNNNEFNLENIQIVTNSAGSPDSREWAVAEYRRDGALSKAIVDTDGTPAGSKTRFLNSTSDLDLGSVRRFLKFNVIVQGGFDGVNIFDKEKASLSDTAIMREVDWPADQGGKNGSTAATYTKAIEVLQEVSDVDIQLLAIPGIRQTLITDKAIEAVEDRFDAMYIMDAIVYDSENTPITGSAQKVSVSNTVNRFSNRVLDSSFAAAYFPDVVLQDPATGINVQAPPSVPVLGAFALNDQLAHPWFAPAGFTRGAMSNVLETQVKMNRDNLDSLYDVDINPLTAFPHTPGVVVFGQKTLLRTQSSLDRVNVRRLLIEIRRRVKRVANNFIFEPNREATLARFSAQVGPILKQIQQQQGVDRFLVKIDTTTTTQNDVENNTLRGKIFLQPTRSVEFISLDFVITNAGAEI